MGGRRPKSANNEIFEWSFSEAENWRRPSKERLF